MRYIGYIFYIYTGVGCFLLGVLGIVQSLSGPDSIALYTARELISLALIWFGIRFIGDREYRAANREKYLRMPGWVRRMIPASSRSQAWISLIYGVLLLSVNVAMEFRVVAEFHFDWL